MNDVILAGVTNWYESAEPYALVLLYLIVPPVPWLTESQAVPEEPPLLA
jgi:hypothetical protein